MLLFENYTNFFIYRYRYVISTIFLVIIAFLLLFIQLGTLLPGISEAEAESVLKAQTLSQITDNPINAPYNLVRYGSLQFFGGSSFGIRIVSAAFGAISLGLLYTLFVTWHRRRIAVLGMALLVGSSWFLHVARFGTPDIMLPIAILLVMSMLTYIHHRNLSWFNILILTIGFAIALYTPYVIYFLLLAVFLYYKEGIAELKKVNPWVMPFGALILVIIAGPLLYSFINNPSSLRIWLGIPNELPSIVGYLDNISSAFAYIFWRSDSNPQLHLGNLAMLDIFTASMTALGLYHYERHLDRLKTRFILSGLLLTFFIVALAGSQFSYALFIPFIYIIAATGIVTLINQWNNIFPRNPVARTAAVIPIALVLFSTISYHTSRYFIAWPRTPETKVAFATEPTLLRNDIERQFPQDKNIHIISTPEKLAQTKASIIGLENNRVISVSVPSDITESAHIDRQLENEAENAEITSFDVIYIEPDAIQGEIVFQLPERPTSTIISAKSNNNVAYRVFVTNQ